MSNIVEIVAYNQSTSWFVVIAMLLVSSLVIALVGRKINNLDKPVKDPMSFPEIMIVLGVITGYIVADLGITMEATLTVVVQTGLIIAAVELLLIYSVYSLALVIKK